MNFKKNKKNDAIITTFFTASLLNPNVLKGVYVKGNIILDTILNLQVAKANTFEQSEHVLTRTKS